MAIGTLSFFCNKSNRNLNDFITIFSRSNSRILDVGKVARHWQATVQDSDVAVTAPDQAVVDTVAVEGATTSDAGEEEVSAKRSPKMP